ncbi:hypothetical protein MPSEU_000832800 [Mayamaea pseudoterrestris]|nr:hypothetical protein MPSEU_000832800 [Mayamaea pseudoterrestris]
MSTYVRCLSRNLLAQSPRRQLMRYVLHRSSSRSLQWRLYSSSSDANTINKRRVVFLGTPEVAATSLQTIHEASLQANSNFQIVGVVTQPPKRRKRNGKVEASPVGKIAQELGIYMSCPEKVNDAQFLNELEQDLRPDLCVTAAYGQYLPKRFLAAPTFGTINIHPSLLPKWRGASPVQRSLQAGDNPVGVTVLFTVSKMDAGPIVAQQAEHVDPDATSVTVLPHLFQIGTQLLLNSLPDIFSGKLTMETARQQDESAVVNAAMIDSSEAELKVWEESALTCHNRLRGFSMWPGVYMFMQIGEREEIVKLQIVKTRVLREKTEPTNIVRLGPTKSDGLYVVCGDGSILELLEVRPVTRRAFPARDFQNGYPNEVIRWVKPISNEDTS